MGEVSRGRLQGGDLFCLRGWGGDLGVGATEHEGKEQGGQGGTVTGWKELEETWRFLGTGC